MTNTISPQAKTAKNPPDVKSPSFLQTVDIYLRPIQFLEAAHKRYGDIFTIRTNFLPAPAVFVSHPQAIRELFTADPKLFDRKTGESAVLGDVIEGDGLSHLETGSDQRRLRSAISSYFPGERIEAYGQIICNITKDEIGKLLIDQPFWAYSPIQKIIYRTLIEIIFGNSKEKQYYDQLNQVTVDIVNFYQSNWSFIFLFPFLKKYLGSNMGSWSPWGKFYRQKELLDKLILAEIQQRQTQPDCGDKDLLGILMSIRNEEGQLITDTSVKAQLMSLIMGNDAVTGIIAWALYWLHRLPAVYEKLMAELDSLSPDVSLREITKLPYLNAVCAETLRMHSPEMGIFQTLKEPFQIAGYQLEPGTILVPAIYLTHHREDIYPDPNNFNPERFLEHQFSPYEYYPFGAGSRACIAAQYSLFEAKLVLATILSQVQLSLPKHPQTNIRPGKIIIYPVDKMVVKGWRR